VPWNAVSLVTVEFHEADGDTRLELTEEGGSLDGLESNEQPTEGVEGGAVSVATTNGWSSPGSTGRDTLVKESFARSSVPGHRDKNEPGWAPGSNSRSVARAYVPLPEA
jgi:hypothetical protein